MSSFPNTSDLYTPMDVDPFFIPQYSAWQDSLVGTMSSSYIRSITTALPEELLEYIINELAPPSSCELEPNASTSNESRVNTNTLFALSLVSKTMNRIVEPVLYKSYSTHLSPRKFLAALTLRRHRTRYVQELIIAPISPRWYSPNLFNLDANLRMLDMDDTISTVLRLCTSLVSLEITLCHEYPGSRTESVVRHWASGTYQGPQRHTLKRVVFKKSCYETCPFESDVEIFRQFPYVPEKVFRGLDLYSMLGRMDTMQICHDAVRRVHISNCCLGKGDDLDELLSMWPMLTSLTLTRNGRALDAKALSAMLPLYCPLLESVQIDTE